MVGVRVILPRKPHTLGTIFLAIAVEYSFKGILNFQGLPPESQSLDFLDQIFMVLATDLSVHANTPTRVHFYHYKRSLVADIYLHQISMETELES